MANGAVVVVLALADVFRSKDISGAERHHDRHDRDSRISFSCLDAYFWRFVDGRPIQNAWKTLSQVPATTALSDSISKDLKQRGFKFVGSTIVYAHMQATGMVNDHLVGCFRHRALRDDG